MKKKDGIKKTALETMEKQKKKMKDNLEDVQKKKKQMEEKMVNFTNETFEILEKAKADQIEEAPIEFDKSLPFFSRIFKFIGQDIGRILKIFWHDVKKLFTNFTAIIVVIGVMILPSLYAWFNILASWDPYGKTGNLSVAVANEDVGASIAGIDIDVGGEIVAALKDNDQIGWVFVNTKEAKEGVESGKYYAAVVIPEHFSKDMLSMLQEELKRPQLDYYVNEKKNAIAPKITNSGVNVVQKMVNEAFIQQAVATVSETIKQLNNEVAGSDIEKKVSEGFDLSVIDKTIRLLEQTEETIGVLETTSLIYAGSGETIDELLVQVSNLIKETEEGISNADKEVSRLKGNMKNTKESMNVMLEDLEGCLGLVKTGSTTLKSKLNTAIKTLSSSADTAYASLVECQSMADNMENIVSEIIRTLKNLDKISSKVSLSEETKKLERVQKKLESLSTSLSGVVKKIEEGKKAGKSDLESARSAAASIESSITEVKTDFSTVKSYVDDTTENITELGETLNTSISSLKNTTPIIQSTIKSTRKALKSTGTSAESVRELVGLIRENMDDQIKSLKKTKKELQSIQDNIGEFLAGQWQDKLEERLGITLPDLTSDTTELADFLSAPVELNDIQVFPIENYGSALAPFYTILCLWVGGLVLVSIFKVKVREDDSLSLKGYRQNNLYYGRYLIFMMIAIVQAIIVCLGDIYVLKIQCLHPGLFVMAGIFASIVFSNIVYTLTLSFGDVGKAIAVVLLVLQVAGAGGTFPIECTPEFFQIINPLLPFTHGINAMREAVGGVYGTAYWMSILKMMIYLPIFLIFGTVFRKPILWLNDFFHHRLEDTKIM